MPKTKDSVRALTNLLFLSAAVCMFCVLWFLGWLNDGQWPDTLRLRVVVYACFGCVVVVRLRWRHGLIPRLAPGSTMTISLAYAAGVVVGLLLMGALLTWAIVRPAS